MHWVKIQRTFCVGNTLSTFSIDMMIEYGENKLFSLALDKTQNLQKYEQKSKCIIYVRIYPRKENCAKVYTARILVYSIHAVGVRRY